MNNLVRSVAILMFVVALAKTSHAIGYYYPTTEEVDWEEVSKANEIFSAGTVFSFLPNGARAIIIERTQYFISGKNWFLPVVDKEGIKYQVVFAPM